MYTGFIEFTNYNIKIIITIKNLPFDITNFFKRLGFKYVCSTNLDVATFI